ncbi:MAG TPA: SPASM domain-containing protein [Bacteroidales bacterium]|nr:SPASM domain-containing protein [Bacteroidales bacterium]
MREILNSMVNIETTNRCPAKCVVCPRDTFKPQLQSMYFNLYTNIIDELVQYNTKVVNLCGFGEIFNDYYLTERLNYTKNRLPNCKIYISTNGYMLYEKYYDLLLKYVDIIKFSIFGVTPKTYQEMHKLQYGRTLNNILNYLDYAKSHTNKPYTSGLFIETDINRHEREDWIKFWEEKLDEVSVWKPHNWLNLRYRIITDNQVSCNRPFSTVYVHANGDVSPCCWDINKKLLVGDLNRNTLTEIMESKALKQIQKKHRRNDFTGLLCGDCDQTCQSEDNLIYSSNKERTIGTYAYEKTVEA